MKRRFCAVLLAAALLAIWCAPNAGAAKAAMTSGEALAAFRAFSEAAAGKYVLEREDDTAVLELVPAFGRLFASVMYYMEDDLYSYYAAELLPGDLSLPENRAGNSETSFGLTVRAYSNMSHAGDYWPGEARQRLTIIGNTLVLTDFEGDGEGLLDGKNALLSRDDNAPGGVRYKPAMVNRIFSLAGKGRRPEALRGAWNASWRVDDAEHSARLTLGADGLMTVLLENPDEPSRLLRGGYAATQADNGVYTLFYVLSALDTGTMPYSGSVRAEPDEDELILSAVEGEDALLLPEGEEMIAFERGEDPLRLGWMRVTDRRDNDDFFDVSVRDPFDEGETALTVRKDGGTTFAWSSSRSVFNLMALRVSIEKGSELPVLYRARGGEVDLLIVLDDIAEDTGALMARAPYFPLLSDYRRQAESGRWQTCEASVFFDEDGEPAITLSGRVNVRTKVELTAAIVRRVGRSFTAVSGPGDEVTFEDWRAGRIAVVDEALTVAVTGFSGFEGIYNRISGQ